MKVEKEGDTRGWKNERQRLFVFGSNEKQKFGWRMGYKYMQIKGCGANSLHAILNIWGQEFFFWTHGCSSLDFNLCMHFVYDRVVQLYGFFLIFGFYCYLGHSTRAAAHNSRAIIPWTPSLRRPVYGYVIKNFSPRVVLSLKMPITD